MNWTAKLEDNLFDGAASEHITLSADPAEEDVAQGAPERTTHRFSQSSKTRKETRGFTIFDDRLLTVSVEQPRAGEAQYQFDLAFLDPTPGRFSGVAWRWLYATVALAIISAFAFAISRVSAAPLLEQQWLPVYVLLAVGTIVLFLMFVYQTSLTVTFYSLHGRAPLVVMAARSPTRPAVESFMLELQQCIEEARQAHWRDKPQFLRDELRAHYRLWEEGVLPDEIYENAKVQILAEHDSG